MTDQMNQEKENKKGFFARLIDKLDSKMEKVVEKKSCCGGGDSDEKKGSSCC